MQEKPRLWKKIEKKLKKLIFNLRHQVSHSEQKNVHVLITSEKEVDNKTLNLVWAKTFFKIQTGLNN